MWYTYQNGSDSYLWNKVENSTLEKLLNIIEEKQNKFHNFLMAGFAFIQGAKISNGFEIIYGQIISIVDSG